MQKKKKKNPHISKMNRQSKCMYNNIREDGLAVYCYIYYKSINLSLVDLNDSALPQNVADPPSHVCRLTFASLLSHWNCESNEACKSVSLQNPFYKYSIFISYLTHTSYSPLTAF